MTQTKTLEEISGYENTKSDFSDFPRFEGKKARRQYEKIAFINNIEYTPSFDYPKLDSLIDDENLVNKKHQIYEAVLELEAAKANGNLSEAELELYASFHENRLKKIMLVEAARNLTLPVSSGDMELNRKTFAELNEAVYGEFDADCYLGMINSEKTKLSNFEPNSQIAYNVSVWLDNELGRIDTKNKVEERLLDDSDLKKLHEVVIDRYKNIFDVVPNTADDVYYDADECVQIMNHALEAGGLAQSGWLVEKNSEKLIPSTAKHKISLPYSTRRNASELRRLIIHEQEVHARRSQNSSQSVSRKANESWYRKFC